ncbi:hypothetical protein [Ancylobacter sp. IITR112]|uniref:hypothetical protein n=1 Tax=Ancylobacter sp. IITR112 TaxID=3138073 RepID=UPI00352A927E
MSRWCMYLVPIEYGEAINRLFNVVNGDEGDNVSIPMSADGLEPATHLMMSCPLTDVQAASYPYSKTAAWSLPSPYTWPLAGGVTSTDVSNAAESAKIATLEDPENTETLPMRTYALISEATGLVRIIPSE